MKCKIIDKNFYCKDLLLINNQALISRYNVVLDELGIEETKLTSFHIDALGWSPEIASEKNDLFYLGVGLSNAVAIILTPNQLTKPAYMPLNSYDQYAVSIFAETYKQEIFDITTTHAICLDIDDSLLNYQSPLDLLLINYIQVKVNLFGLDTCANEQLSLVKKYLEKPFGWMNSEIRTKIIESAKKYGDLRYRKTSIEPLTLAVPKLFYSNSFYGVFLMTNTNTKHKFLILENQKQELEKYINNKSIFSITHSGLLDILYDANLVYYSQNYWEVNLNELKNLIDFLKLEIISKMMPNQELADISETKLKRFLMNSDDNKYITILEQVYKNLENNKTIDFHLLPEKIQWTLIKPYEGLSYIDKLVIEQVRSLKAFISPLELYNINKKLFFKTFFKFNNNLKRWIINNIYGVK